MNIGSKDILIFFEWLRVREDNGLPFPKSLQELIADAEKSALLQRLISGKPALPLPPPRINSTPNYDLIEEGQYCPDSVRKMPSGWQKTYKETMIVIDGNPWQLLKVCGLNDYIVAMRGRLEEKYRVSVIGRLEDGGKATEENLLWLMAKVD